MPDFSSHISVGRLMQISSVPDQSLYVQSLRGKLCVVVRHCTAEHGVVSSRNIWDVLVDGKVISLHALDLQTVQTHDGPDKMKSGGDDVKQPLKPSSPC